MDCSPPDSSVMEFSRQEYRSGVPFPTPGDRPNPGMEPESFVSPALAGLFFFTASATWEAPYYGGWVEKYLKKQKLEAAHSLPSGPTGDKTSVPPCSSLFRQVIS